MKWAVSILCQAHEASDLKRNDKLPLNDQLKVKLRVEPHPKNIESGVDKVGRMYEISGTLPGDRRAAVIAEIGESLEGVAKPDGFVTLEIEPK